MIQFFIIVIGLATALMSVGCESEKELPPASGISGDIYIIMDKAQKTGALKQVLDSLIHQPFVGLPRPESIFHGLWIDPLKLNYVLLQRRNLIFIAVLDQQTSGTQAIRKRITADSWQKAQAESSPYIRIVRDVFAKNQEVVYILSPTEEQMIRYLRQRGDQLIHYLNQSEEKRLRQTLFKGKSTQKHLPLLRKTYNCRLSLPFGYKVAQHKEDFFWARQINPRDDKNIFFARKKYRSSLQFSKDSLIAFRNAVCKKYLYEDPERLNTYLITETEINHKPVQIKEIVHNTHYAIEMRGLWRTHNVTMGGPFLSHTLVDESSGYLYYVEGFLYSPTKNQRELMRELEVIINTFAFHHSEKQDP